MHHLQHTLQPAVHWAVQPHFISRAPLDHSYAMPKHMSRENINIDAKPSILILRSAVAQGIMNDISKSSIINRAEIM